MEEIRNIRPGCSLEAAVAREVRDIDPRASKTHGTFVSVIARTT
jgi:hypothetical protein